MPPRKSGASAAGAADANGDVSMISNATNATTSPTQHAHPKQSRQSGGSQMGGKQDDGVGIDDLLLPRSLVSRLTRGVLPPNTSLQKDALLALTRSATVFISYLAHHANEQSQLRHRKTLGVQDVYAALREIELQGVMDVGVVGIDGRSGGRLEREVAMYEEAVMKKRRGYRDKVKARESGGAADGWEGEGEGDEDRGEPSSKKVRRMSEQENDDDEEERMLEQQLNGTTHSADVEIANGTHGRSSDAAEVSVVVQNGHGRPNEQVLPVSDGQVEDEEVEEADDVEDDPAGDDEAEEDQDEADDDDEDDEEADGDETDDEARNDDLDADINGLNRGLLPNGEVEIDSGDESEASYA